MVLPTTNGTSVFCDWLDVTMPPTESYRVLTSLGQVFCSADGLKLAEGLYEVGHGKVKMGTSRGIFRVSLSGGVIRHLEQRSLWGEVLFHLGEGPHRVTRVDCAMDIPYDGADALDALQRAFPRGEVRLTQRPVRITEMVSTRSDGRKTGTWYAGHRSGAEVTCRVYDKAHQLLETKGEGVPPRTRIELTVRKGPGPTLRDAFQPERIFWHYMAPTILKRPESVPDWSSGWGEGWRMERNEVLPADALKRRIEHSPELAAISELADSLGVYGRQMAVRLVAERLGVQLEPGSFPRPEAGTGLLSSKAAH